MTQSKTLMASRMNRKGSCPVLSGGKSSDNIKGLPIAISAHIDENRPLRLRIFEDFLEIFKGIVLDGRTEPMI